TSDIYVSFLGQPPAKALLSASGKQSALYGMKVAWVCGSDTSTMNGRARLGAGRDRVIEEPSVPVLTSASCRPKGSRMKPRSRTSSAERRRWPAINAAAGTVFRTREQEERAWPVTHQR